MTISNDDIVEVAAAAVRELKLREEIAQVFRELRFEAGWTQREAAERIGTSQQNLPRLERGGTDLKLSTLQKFAAAYGYNVEISFTPFGEE